MSVLIGLWLARPVTAFAPQQSNSEDYISSDITIKDNAIIRPNSILDSERSTNRPVPSRERLANERVVQSGWHSTRAERTISEDSLMSYLQQRGSPLAPYASQILESPYYSTIIGICTIEQYGCTKAPGNNYWGIMCSGGRICRYESLGEGINAISDLLAKYDTKGKDTIEELNGYYVVPASSNWLNTVIRTKNELESLQ